MTLATSKYSRYDIDERLTIDDHLVKGPLESKKDIASSVCTTQSSASESTSESTSASTSPTQRSIFSAYWKTDSRLSRSLPSLISSRNSEVEEEQQQHRQDQQQEQQPQRQQQQQHHSNNCPRQRRRIFNNKTYSYTYDGDPYQYFGIEEEEDETSTTEDDDSDSLNSYERILQKNEFSDTTAKNHHRIGNRRRRSRTCASLSFERVGMLRTMVDSTKQTTQSDTVLFAQTSSSLQRVSCLRKSRFAVAADSSNNNSSESDADNDTDNDTDIDIDTDSSTQSSSVSFEARIQVRLFIPPVENWAPSGWSNWFGGWQ